MLETTLPVIIDEPGRFSITAPRLTPKELHEYIASAVRHCENCKRATDMQVAHYLARLGIILLAPA